MTFNLGLAHSWTWLATSSSFARARDRISPQLALDFWAHKEALVTGQDEDIDIDLTDA
jgi:hypothetical protein